MHKKFTAGALWPDTNGVHINAHGGGILFYHGIYYWFGEHKIAGRAGNKAHVGVHCYASSDLYNWEDKGIALHVVDDPDSAITKGCVLERPKVIYNIRTQKFVMWFHLELKGQSYRAARSGVAVSDCVTGPYTFLHAFRPNAGVWPDNVTPELQNIFDDPLLSQKAFSGNHVDVSDQDKILGRDFKGGQMARDMTLFIDDDGSAYHIFASEENSTLHISQLSDDYLSSAGKYIRVFPNRFMEAPAICKRQGRYYFIGSGCTGWTPNAARSAVADSIWGPWTELGNPCVGDNSELTFGGQSTYILPVEGQADAYIAMFDLWRPGNAIDGRYMWLPLEFEDERLVLRYRETWDLSFFE
ncbi:MAG: glycoside hydrolase family 43 protein [Anaerolineae bacterium]|nr:glycoside hydrolase family 43 protein [Anaerolineae bacterium]